MLSYSYSKVHCGYNTSITNSIIDIKDDVTNVLRRAFIVTLEAFSNDVSNEVAVCSADVLLALDLVGLCRPLCVRACHFGELCLGHGPELLQYAGE